MGVGVYMCLCMILHIYSHVHVSIHDFDHCCPEWYVRHPCSYMYLYIVFGKSQ